jgi:hypothetical protein
MDDRFDAQFYQTVCTPVVTRVYCGDVHSLWMNAPHAERGGAEGATDWVARRDREAG